jgi:hypothetical protein
VEVFLGATYGVVWLNEWIVDGNNLDIIVLNSVTEDLNASSQPPRLKAIPPSSIRTVLTILPILPKPLIPT